MSILLLPRLTAVGVSNILKSMSTDPLTPARAQAIIEDGASMLSYAASGGSRSDGLASELGSAIRDIALRSGFPDNPSQVAKSGFDHEVAIHLASHPDLGSGESLRDDVWSYLATAMVPDKIGRAHV